MFNHLLEHDIDLGPAFVVRTRDITELLTTDITKIDGSNAHRRFGAGVADNCVVLFFALAFRAWMGE